MLILPVWKPVSDIFCQRKHFDGNIILKLYRFEVWSWEKLCSWFKLVTFLRKTRCKKSAANYIFSQMDIPNRSHSCQNTKYHWEGPDCTMQICFVSVATKKPETHFFAKQQLLCLRWKMNLIWMPTPEGKGTIPDAKWEEITKFSCSLKSGNKGHVFSVSMHLLPKHGKQVCF